MSDVSIIVKIYYDEDESNRMTVMADLESILEDYLRYHYDVDFVDTV